MYCKNTMNLFVHIERHHPDVYSSKFAAAKKKDLETGKSKPKQQVTISSCFNVLTPYPKASARYKECDSALVSFICKDLQPISVVESPSFREFVETLDGQYTPMSRNHYSRSAIRRGEINDSS